MAYWRMRMRDGKGGPDLWPVCEKHNIAAITYNGIDNVDLAPYSEKVHPPRWDEIKGSAAKTSLSRFAWQIRGGDTIFVTGNGKIVGMGHPRVESGKLAYRFDPNSPVVPEKGETWRHLIDMDWESNFSSFKPESMRAPLYTVLDLHQDEVDAFLLAARLNELREAGIKEPDLGSTLLLEDEYTRYTPMALRQIKREHSALSNRFATWLQETHKIRSIREKMQIDATFITDNAKFLVEFKIAYQGNTKRAIREALGQILEYNYYPPRASHDHWLLTLNASPGEDDRKFLRLLVEAFRIPLSIGWEVGAAFQFDPVLRL